jgi:hypothetical protein
MKLGRELFSWTVDLNNYNQLMGVKNDQNSIKNVKIGAWKKSTVRVFLGSIFVFLDRFWGYRDLSKNRPHKKHCAWAPTPPWEIHKIYRFFSIFDDFGAFNRAGKTVIKIGIYALPPLKRYFYAIFINSRPNFVCHLFFFKIFINDWF